VFQQTDVDHSGFLDSDEIAILSDKLGFPKQAVEVYIKEFDNNSDGKMSLEEFVEFFNQMKHPSKAAKQRVKRLVSVVGVEAVEHRDFAHAFAFPGVPSLTCSCWPAFSRRGGVCRSSGDSRRPRRRNRVVMMLLQSRNRRTSVCPLSEPLACCNLLSLPVNSSLSYASLMRRLVAHFSAYSHVHHIKQWVLEYGASYRHRH